MKQKKLKKSKKLSVRLRHGKADFIKRRTPEGREYKVCLCDINIDLSNRGCPMQVPGPLDGPLLSEVQRNNGQYSKETRARLRAGHPKGKLPDTRCMYCYARRHNWGRVTPVHVTEKTLEDFELYFGRDSEERPRVIRIGKNNEAGHPFYHQTLVGVLKLCRQYHIHVIFPTKALAYDDEIAELLRETNSVLNFSICNDSLEPGAVSQGFTNEWRIKQAGKYRGLRVKGVNTTLTITCDVTSSFDENEERGFLVRQALQNPHGIGIRFFPIRLNSRNTARLITGREWEEVVYKGQMHPAQEHLLPGFETLLKETEESLRKRPYIYHKGQGIPRFFHPDFDLLIRHAGAGVCGPVGHFMRDLGYVDYVEHCDKCNLEGFSWENFPVSQLVPVEYNNEKEKERKRYRERHRKKNLAKRHRGQCMLFEN